MSATSCGSCAAADSSSSRSWSSNAGLNPVPRCLDLGTLDRVLREGPWWSEAEHWSQLSSSTRAAWLFDWLEQLVAEKRAGAGGAAL
jgi:hypothetical protein